MNISNPIVLEFNNYILSKLVKKTRESMSASLDYH